MADEERLYTIDSAVLHEVEELSCELELLLTMTHLLGEYVSNIDTNTTQLDKDRCIALSDVVQEMTESRLKKVDSIATHIMESRRK